MVSPQKLPDAASFDKEDLDNLSALSPLLAALIYRLKLMSVLSGKLGSLDERVATATDTFLSQDVVQLRISPDLQVVCVSFPYRIILLKRAHKHVYA